MKLSKKLLCIVVQWLRSLSEYNFENLVDGYFKLSRTIFSRENKLFKVKENELKVKIEVKQSWKNANVVLSSVMNHNLLKSKVLFLKNR